ncbi:MAG: ankyrin repeat protein [uncultured bacterium]|nr:MAG: ankyrin repeat protein [uncultured bacterium]
MNRAILTTILYLFVLNCDCICFAGQLRDAVLNNSTGEAQLLIENGAQLNVKDVNGWTALHVAAKFYSEDAARIMIIKGADINARDKNGYTPLHWAAIRDSKAVTRLLIKKAINVNAKDKKGFTPLHYARKNSETKKLIEDAGGVE